MPTARGKLRGILKARKLKKSSSPRFKSSFQMTLIKLAVWAVLLIGTLALAQTLVSAWREKVWIPGTRLTIIVAQEDPIIYSFDPQQGKLLSFKVPKNTQVQTAGSYGPWLSGSLWELGKQEEKDGELLRLSLQKALGIPIDAWVEEDGTRFFENNTLGWVSASWQALVSGNLDTNLTFFDRASLIFGVGKLTIRDRREIDLESAGVIVPTKLSDGVRGFTVVPEKAKVALDSLRDDLVFEEEKKVIITNTTSKGGLATSTAQIGAVLGARVIGVDSSEEEVENCEIRGVKKDLNSLTTKRLAAIFSCEIKETSSSGAADLELILGKNFVERF